MGGIGCRKVALNFFYRKSRLMREHSVMRMPEILNLENEVLTSIGGRNCGEEASGSSPKGLRGGHSPRLIPPHGSETPAGPSGTLALPCSGLRIRIKCLFSDFTRKCLMAMKAYLMAKKESFLSPGEFRIPYQWQDARDTLGFHPHSQ